MDHYLDIRLLPDPEFSPTHLMNALFAKLHRVLAHLGSDNVGITFPTAQGQKHGLGTCIRLHGTEVALKGLMTHEWLAGVRDHVRLCAITMVPTHTGWWQVRRVQAKSNPERLRRRMMKRKGCTAEQARAAIPDAAAEMLNLPFLSVRSSSTGQAFRVFVRQKPTESPVGGKFNAYGFSSTASLPRF